MSLVTEGHKNWGTLAAHIPGRTSKQCRERWCHHLDPRIVKGDWTQEEDQIIVSLHGQLGNKWATIAQVLSGRGSSNQSVSRSVSLVVVPIATLAFELFFAAPEWPHGERHQNSLENSGKEHEARE